MLASGGAVHDPSPTWKIFLLPRFPKIIKEIQGMKTKMRKKKDDNVVEIDSDNYEKLALIGMKWGIDDPIEFINAVLYYQMKKMQEDEDLR